MGALKRQSDQWADLTKRMNNLLQATEAAYRFSPNSWTNAAPTQALYLHKKLTEYLSQQT
jgi:hypothetical protein